MQTITSAKVQANFGAVADIVKRGEPVTITQHGRPTMMMLTYEEGAEFVRQRATQDLLRWFEDRRRDMPQAARDLTQEELDAMIEEEREAVYQENLAKAKRAKVKRATA
jgi:prevent-host-death family protein